MIYSHFCNMIHVLAQREDNLEDAAIGQTQLDAPRGATKPAAKEKHKNEKTTKKVSHAQRLRDAAVMLAPRVCLALRPGKKSPKAVGWQKHTETQYADFTANTVGMGLLCGSRSGCCCVDIDDMSAWGKLLEFHDAVGSLDGCPSVATPSGGLHIYFLDDVAVGTGTAVIECVDETGKKRSIGVDTRGQNSGQCILPPSKYCTDKPDKKQHVGIEYAWVRDFEDGDLIEMPAWLKSLVTKQQRMIMHSETRAFTGSAVIPLTAAPGKSKPSTQPNSASTASNPQQRQNTASTQKAVVTLTDPRDFDQAFDTLAAAEEVTPHDTLTFEQVTELVQSLKKARFASYDSWCHLLWAVARWAADTDADEDAVIEMLDAYSQQCDGYESSAVVAKKYREAFKRSNRSSKVTVGTLLHWAREDRGELKQQAAATLAEALVAGRSVRFDRTDTYCFLDFATELQSVVHESKEALGLLVAQRMPRVMAKVLLGKGFYLKKDNTADAMFSVADTLGAAGDFNISYRTTQVNSKTKKAVERTAVMSFSKYLKLSTIPFNQFSSVGCFPDETVKPCPAGYSNIWEGLQAQKVVEVDESQFADITYILRELWASGDEGLYQYLLGWLRFCIARPAEMTKTALFLYSDDGAGKGTIIDFLMTYVFGLGITHSFTGIEEAVEKHCTNKKGKKLIYINEMGSTRDQFLSNFDKIKPPITDPIITENPKGKTIMKIDNIANVILGTNHKDARYITDKDRRYTCIEVADTKCGAEHKEWWGGVYQRVMRQETADHFMTWLLKWDEAELPNPRVIYYTALRAEIQELSRNNILLFLDDLLEEEANKEEAERVLSHSASALFRDYRMWCSEHGEHAKAAKHFGMLAKTRLTFRKTRDGAFYDLPVAQ